MGQVPTCRGIVTDGWWAAAAVFLGLKINFGQTQILSLRVTMSVSTPNKMVFDYVYGFRLERADAYFWERETRFDVFRLYIGVYRST